MPAAYSKNTGLRLNAMTTSLDSMAMISNLSILSAADSPARISVLPDTVADSTVNAADSGMILPGSFAWYDRASCSWKMWQLCFSGGLEIFSEPFPIAGSMRNGQLFPRAPWVLHICDNDCSLWPTPTASMDGRGFGIPLHDKSGRFRRSIVLRVQELVRKHGWRIHPNFTEALMNLPQDWTAIG